jgi:hypothetical protein
MDSKDLLDEIRENRRRIDTLHRDVLAEMRAEREIVQRLEVDYRTFKGKVLGVVALLTAGINLAWSYISKKIGG